MFPFNRKFHISFFLFTLFASLFMFLNSCSGGTNGENGDVQGSFLDRLTDEHLSSFNIDGVPLAQGSGHSQAFKIHPLKELRISVPAGAFELNPQIEVSVAKGEDIQMLDSVVSNNLPNHELLYAYELDAGLPSDSVMPGKMLVEINLKKLGIPKELYPYISLARVDEQGNLMEVNSHVTKGVLKYYASQNSWIVITGAVAIPGLIIAGFYTGQFSLPMNVTKSLQAWKAAGYPAKFWKKNDLVTVPVKDKNGNFNVVFRFLETEDAARFPQYLDKTTQLEERIAQHTATAQQMYDKDHPVKPHMPTHLADNPYEEVDPVEIMERRVGRYRIYHDLLKKDTLYQNLKKDPDIKLPQSVQDIIAATKLVHQFSLDTLGLGMKPLSYTYNLYIVSSTEIGNEKGVNTTEALFQPIPGGSTGKLMTNRVYINYECYLEGEEGNRIYDRSKADILGISMAHEIGHAFENEYINTVWSSNLQFFEAIGSVTEHWFAAWMKKKGLFKDEDTESPAAAVRLGYAERFCKQLLAWPLGTDYPKSTIFKTAKLLGVEEPQTFGGYMLGDLLQYMCDHTKKVNFDRIMSNFSSGNSFVENLKAIFDLKNDKNFAIVYEKFLWHFMPEIVQRQTNSKYDQKYINKPQVQNRIIPVHRFRILGHQGGSTAYPFTVKILRIVSDEEKEKIPYNVFAVPSEKIADPRLKFSLIEGDSAQPKDRYYIEPCAKEFQKTVNAALIYRPGIEEDRLDKDYYVDLVAFYRPKSPVIDGETKDTEGLNIDLVDEPAKALLQAKYITGMQIAVVNKAKKKNKTFNVPLSKCGKTVKIPYNEIWISDPEEIDIAVRTRWYYKTPDGKNYYYSPATDRVNYKRKKKIEHQDEEKVKPEQEENEFRKRPEGEVTEDLGEVVIDAKYAIDRMATTNVMHGYWLDYTSNNDGAPIYAHIVVKGKTATITIPTHSVNHAIPENRSHANFEFTGFTIKCKCRIVRESDAVYAMFESLESVSPSSSTRTEVGDYWQVIRDPDPIDNHYSTKASSTIQFKSSQKLHQETGLVANQVYLENDRSKGAFSIQLFVHEKYHSVTSNTHWPDSPLVYDGDEDTFVEIKGVLNK